jgi:uncharacterized cupin superfamily protein
MSLVCETKAVFAAPTEELSDWGFRAGAEAEGTCKIGGKIMSAANGVKTGVWECTPGTFTVVDRPNVESITILSGKVRITDLKSDNAAGTILTAGDSAVLELGSTTKWEVLETVRKFFVIAPQAMTDIQQK